MAKRPRVPAALHAELTEYSSLLRALRTSDTLDLTLHLTQPPPSFISQASLAGGVALTDDGDDDGYIDDDDDGDDDDDDDDDSNDDDNGGDVDGDADEEEALDELPPTDAVSQDAFSDGAFSSQLNLKQPPSKRKAKQRDTWTRWPLLAGDVHVPEWNLSDEVKNIAERVLAVSSPNQPVVVPEPGAEEATPCPETSSDPLNPFAEQDDHSIPDVVLQALAANSAAFLARILALVTAHVPAAEKSMQNRITPISWETVVDVACSNGIISPRVAEVVRERMSSIFSPAEPSTIHRTQHLLTMRQRTSQMLSKHDDSILEVPDYTLDVCKKPVKRKRGPPKKKAAAAEAEAGPSTSAPKHQRLKAG